MAGTIRRRGQTWQIQVRNGVDPVTGRNRFETRTVRTDATRAGRKEAERQLARLVLDVESRRIPTSDDLTVAELLARWSTHAAAVKAWSPKTVLEVGRTIDGRIVPALGPTPLHRLRAGDLDAFYAQQLATGSKTGGPLAPATVVKAHRILHAALAQAVKWGLIATNPAAATSPPAQPPTRITPPSPAEVSKALAAVDETEPALGVYLRLAAVTGARRSQLVALHWEDVDLDAGSIEFRRAIVDGGRDVGLVEKGTKSGQPYTVPITGRAAALLSAHRAACEAAADACRVTLPPGGYVFSAQPDGSVPWRPDRTTFRWIRLRRAAGLDERIRLHDLRHAAVTQMIAAGVDVATVAGMVGHGNSAVTLAVYAHHLPERGRAAAQILDDLYD